MNRIFHSQELCTACSCWHFMQMVLFYVGPGPKTSCPGDFGGVRQLPEDVECGREGLLQYNSKSQIISPSFCVFFLRFWSPSCWHLAWHESGRGGTCGRAGLGSFSFPLDPCPVQLVPLQGAGRAEFLEPQV